MGDKKRKGIDGVLSFEEMMRLVEKNRDRRRVKLYKYAKKVLEGKCPWAGKELTFDF